MQEVDTMAEKRIRCKNRTIATEIKLYKCGKTDNLGKAYVGLQC